MSAARGLDDVVEELRSVLVERRDAVDVGARRHALARLWRVATSAPDRLNGEFRGLTEEDLAPSVIAARDALDEGRLLLPTGRSWRDLAIAVGAQLRALDAALAEAPTFVGPAAGPETYLVPEAGLHVVPRTRAKRGLRAGPGAGFRRRSTPHHRFLPIRLGDHPIELVFRPQLARPVVPVSATRRLGAALLPGMSLEPIPDITDWIAGAAPCPDEQRILAVQVDGAYDDGVFVAVWPELSMPPERLALLRDGLARRSRLMEEASGPSIVAAGSWHEYRNGVLRNVTRILDASGMQHLEFWKVSAYTVGKVREGSVAHDVIPILVTDDALVTFGICLDFCDLETTFRYDLDVDLVVVPSHGNRRTMSGHEANAARLNASTGGRAFVVQHSDAETPVGWVLPGADPGRPEMLDEDREWSVRDVPRG